MGISGEEIKERLNNVIKCMLSSELGLSESRIDTRVPIEKYGMNSIMIMQFTNQLEKKFGMLSKTILFEYETIQALSNYLYDSKQDKVYEVLNVNRAMEQSVQSEHKIEHKKQNAEKKNNLAHFINKKPVLLGKSNESTKKTRSQRGWDIAVIGLAGQYPKSDNMDMLWKNLKDGVDCITEIPKERWDHSIYYSPDKSDSNKTYAKWGGFLNDMDCFDPLFFHISPAEAEAMDPQERLFLQCVYHAIEDAGYTGETLAKRKHNGMANQVGVFAGVMYEEYQLYGAQAQQRGRMYSLNGSEASIANRVSYIYGFHGPSMSVDTMCSSSLTALQLACKSILNQECEVAIAGGVNVSLHPNKFIMLGQSRFVSDVGRCETFGDGGSGYVPGEGVGAVVLKPLKQAVKDGDHIYGVIKSVALNHGGKNGGYTVPNPHAQTSVVLDAWEEAGINPKAISYIEAHGTGTSLGDPIEISALNKAFEGKTEQKQFCKIGSIKSNIGHCESAAGIAGISKVLLQMKYGYIVPSLHSKVLNKNIDFENSPFTVPQQLTEWKRPEFLENGQNVEYPRIAGISAFGAGGSNAHVVIEEYIPENTFSMPVQKEKIPVFALSAKSKEQVMEQARLLKEWLEENENVDMSDLAFTLLVGREALDKRLAILSDTREELCEKLSRAAAGDFSDAHYTTVKNTDSILGIFDSDEEMEELIQKWIQSGKFTKLSKLWVNGLYICWENVLSSKYHRLSLPGYPFKKEHYWAPKKEDLKVPVQKTELNQGLPYPLLSSNTSDFTQQRYSAVFTGQEPFLAAHVVAGKKMLPAVVFMEMVYEGLADALPITNQSQFFVQLEDIMWLRPCVVEKEPRTVHVGYQVEDEDKISFEIYSDGKSEDESILYCTGRINLDAQRADKSYDIDNLKKSNAAETIEEEALYEYFAGLGMMYGTEQRAISKLWKGEHTILAFLKLPETLTSEMSGYTLYPAIMDSALQACGGFNQISQKQGGDSGEKKARKLPFAVGKMSVYRPCQEKMWAYLTTKEERNGVENISIDLCDEQGNVCISLEHIMFREVKDENPASKLLVYQKEFEQIDSGKKAKKTFSREDVICVNLSDEMEKAVLSSKSWNHVWKLNQTENKEDSNFIQLAAEIFVHLKEEIQRKQQDKVLLQVFVSNEQEGCLLEGLSGLLKTASLEKPQIICQLIVLDKKTRSSQISEAVSQASKCVEVPAVIWKDGSLYKESYKKAQLSNEQTEVFQDGEVYLITGGLGSIGLLFAKEIAFKTKDAVIVLTGRRVLDDEKKQKLSAIEKLGATCVYYQSDISNLESVEQLVDKIETQFKGLHGIIHCAGIMNDSYIYKKEKEQFISVLKPKVAGTYNLDHATKDRNLRFFILFSSLSAVTGNAGQADYATGNAYMDSFAAYRNELVSQGKRTGKTISYNWPYWKDGGFRLDAQIVDAIYKQNGITMLDTDSALTAFYACYSDNASQHVVVKGLESKINAMFEGAEPELEVQEKPAYESTVSESKLADKTREYLSGIFSDALKIPASKIEPDAFYDTYGVDSIFTMRITEKLEKEFGSLSRTLLFEYQTLEQLTNYFVGNHAGKLKEMFSFQEETLPIVDKKAVNRSISKRPMKKSRFQKYMSYEKKEFKKPSKDIAIIGIAGRYPQADNVEAFWNNLCAGKDCITEIPIERWDYKKYYSEKKEDMGCSYSKWGGFVEDFDAFDPMFFHIPPVEAKFLDPQERLFLQTVWEAVEDAGYTRKSLKDEKVGVFTGIMYSLYQMYGVQTKNGRLAGSSSYSSIANRISYLFDFKGPSIALDTMCSSSLTTIYLACESIKSGASTMAVAGGVNLSLHPQKYIQLCQSGFLSTDGRCRSFGAGGDGYVPGEGVGAVILKDLDRAVEDKDHIYGVIKAAAINSGGKVSGYTVPNQNAQRTLIEDTLKAADIDPSTISYVEAHGTGTSLGDPIEVNAITQAYRQYTDKRQYCSIGSVKSNIGHCESAAGIAALTKVLMQMKYKKLVPSLHSKTLNPYIHFEDTPFVVQQELEEWKQPVIDGKCYPRRAAISAFGAGGSNAHLIVEEYDKNLEPAKDSKEEQIFILSAKNKDRLKEYAERFKAYLKDTFELESVETDGKYDTLEDIKNMIFRILGVEFDGLSNQDELADLGMDAYQYEQMRQQLMESTGKEFTEKQMRDCKTIEDLLHLLNGGYITAANNELPKASLEDIAYTLQTGREPMEERVIFFAKDYKQLLVGIQEYLSEDSNSMNYKTSNILDGQERFSSMLKNKGMKEYLESILGERKIAELGEYWLLGAQIDWNLMYNEKKNKVSLPVYPFYKEHYMLDMIEGGTEQEEVPAKTKKEYLPMNKGLDKTVLTSKVSQLSESITDKQLETMMEEYIKNVFVETLNIPYEYLNSNSDYESYGIDSIHINHINQYLEKQFGILPSTLLFTYKTIHSLSGYFVNEQKEAVLKLLQTDNNTESYEDDSIIVKEPEKLSSQTVKEVVSQEEEHTDNQDIAIIGISGRFPQANQLSDYLVNLEEGKDCITEIPKERWNYEDYPEIKCKWGGFIEDADKFDPQFFNISPANAIFMDPQERLFVQYVWKCLEDAGYTPENMPRHSETDTRANVSVFAGVTFNEYGLYGAADIANGRTMPLNSQIYSIANRVSYLFNFGGPSLSVDTACSSSLYAIHLACESLHKGESEMAIAGGVNLSLHPSKYITLNWAKFLASDGHCHTFGKDGDGYVPGEGVGAVLLKPLWKAKEDHDHIYGVIKGSAVNHGGKTYGYSVPNPVAQSEVIDRALKISGIHPRTIGYVEAHGTGTALGDPIEISALTDVYKKYTDDLQYCAIGSVKSNIGHLEAAAGISQLLKVILQIQKKELFPSRLNSDELNPNIDFEHSPFHVQMQKEAWKPVTLEDGKTECPRRAALSAFGVGGVNVHMIVEEYKEPEQPKEEPLEDVCIPVSAKSEKALKQYVEEWIAYIEEKEKKKEEFFDIRDVASTLWNGRIELIYRAAFVVKDFSQMKQYMKQYLAGEKNEMIYTGKVLLVGNTQTTEDNISQRENSRAKQLAFDWVHGRKNEIEPVEEGYEPKKVPLPGYPFEKEEYWLYSKQSMAKRAENIPEKQSEPEQEKGIILRLQEAYEGERQQILIEYIQDLFAEILCFTDGRKPDVEEGFFALGLESVASRQAQLQLEDELHTELDDQLFFNYPNITEVAKYILTVINLDSKETKEEFGTQEKGEAVLFYPQWMETDALASAKSFGNQKVLFVGAPDKIASAVSSMISRTAKKNIKFVKDKQELIKSFDKMRRYPDELVIFSESEKQNAGIERIQERMQNGIGQTFEMIKYLAKNAKKQISILYVYQNEETIESAEQAAFGGFFKSMHLEHSMFEFKTIQVQPDSMDSTKVVTMLLTEIKAGCHGEEIAYREGKRYEKRLIELTDNKLEKEGMLKENGVYLMIGGCGGVASILATYMAEKYHANLVLTSRRDLNEKGIMQIKNIENAGGKAIYIKADVSVREDVKVLVAKVIERFGHIDGVFHTAGVIKDSMILNKTEQEFREVLLPKVYGTQYLDEALKDEKLDFFVMFSSLSAMIGNVGQCDYCYANSFLDEFAQVRDKWVKEGRCHGKTYSINWSFWRNGGMLIDANTEKWMDKKLGLLLMDDERGIEVLERAIRAASSQVVLLNGRADKIRSAFHVEDNTTMEEPEHPLEKTKSDTLELGSLFAGSEELPEEYEQMGEDALIAALEASFLHSEE